MWNELGFDAWKALLVSKNPQRHRILDKYELEILLEVI
jgi:hypothetical protein